MFFGWNNGICVLFYMDWSSNEKLSHIAAGRMLQVMEHIPDIPIGRRIIIKYDYYYNNRI